MKFKRVYIFTFFLLFIIPLSIKGQAHQLHNILKNASKAISNIINSEKSVLIIDFFNKSDKITPLGEYMSEEIGTQLKNNNNIKLLSQKTLNDIIKEKQYTETELILNKNKLSELLGTEILIFGRYEIKSTVLLLKIKVYNAITMEILEVSDLEMNIIERTKGNGAIYTFPKQRTPEIIEENIMQEVNLEKRYTAHKAYISSIKNKVFERLSLNEQNSNIKDVLDKDENEVSVSSIILLNKFQKADLTEQNLEDAIITSWVNFRMNPNSEDLNYKNFEEKTSSLGLVQIVSEPIDALIYINGNKISQTTNTNLWLDSGNYKFNFKKAGYKDLNIEQNVKELKINKIDLKLLKK